MQASSLTSAALAVYQSSSPSTSSQREDSLFHHQNQNVPIEDRIMKQEKVMEKVTRRSGSSLDFTAL